MLRRIKLIVLFGTVFFFLSQSGSIFQCYADRHPYVPSDYQSTILYDEDPIVWENVFIEMRDGTRLSTDIYFPSKDGERVDEQFPVLLQRTPYDKAGGSNRGYGDYFARRGYIVAIQDTRGRFASSYQGIWLGYTEGNQGKDGYDTIEWLATDPGVNSTGQVGMWGWSYPGVMEYAAAALNPPHLKAIVPGAAHSDYARIGLRNHGAFEMRFYHYAFMMAGWADSNRYVIEEPWIAEYIRDQRIPSQNFWYWLDQWPIKRGNSPLNLTPDYEDYYFLVATSGDWPGPDEFWKYPGHNFEMYYEQASDIPMAHLTGWYDTYTQAEGENFTALSAIQQSPHMLLIGPRTHTTSWYRTYAGDAEFGPAAADDYKEFILRWMDQYLKGIDTGLQDEPPVRLWAMGDGSGGKTPEGRLDVGGKWVWEDEYPLARTQYRKFYFWPDGSLKPDRVFPPQGGSITYTYDPDNPVPTIGGNISAFSSVVVAGGFNQVLTEDFYVRGVRNNGQPLAERPDVIVFQTDPLKEDMELIGPIKVILYASSSATDTDFTAKIIDVYPPNEDYPDGYALNLEDGIVRARYRKGRVGNHMTAKFIKPGKIYEFTIQPYDIGNRFKAGHRLRVDISSSNYPRFDLNPNTGEPLAEHTHTVPAENTIYISRARPSHVLVPFIPIGDDD